MENFEQMKYLLIILLLGGCSHHTSKTSRPGESNEEPKWLYAPYEGCSEASELCATGEGKTSTQADSEARANLASIFEVRVKSDVSITTSSTQSFPWQAEVKEEVLKSVQESVDQILESVQIKNHHRKQGISHSLASLDRQTAGGLIRGRMGKLDDELEVLWNTHQRTNLRRIVKLFMERERLNERYSIVSGMGIPSKVSWAEIIKWRASKPKSEPVLLKIGQAPDWLKEKLSELLSESGFHIVKGDADKIVTVQVDSIKEFLNVEGFEKFTFTVSISSVVDGGQKRTISTSDTVTGRTQADALLKVKNSFNDYIEQHLSDLRLD